MIGFKNAMVYSGGTFHKKDVCFDGGHLIFGNAENYYNGNVFIFPGFSDVHVHLREPGFSYKETIASGTAAAAAGGYTCVCSMPNLKPVPDSVENIKIQLDIISKDACVNVYPYAAITKGEQGEELSEMEELVGFCAAFSDDGRGVQNADIMREAMRRAKKCGKIIAAHCEDNSLLNGGYIHDGEYAKIHNHRGISSESEWRQIERDLCLAKETGCRYHVCHVSAKESVELIRRAKADGVDVTCETAPHYLIFTDDDLKEDGCFKMNPPLRSKEDKEALIKGIKDGTIDMIATDHAPHSREEKSGGLEKSLMGIVGLETAFSALYTHLVKTNIISLEKLIELLSVNPSKRFCLPNEDCYTVFDLEKKRKINSDNFLSKGKSSPFDGEELYGKCLLTAAGGNVVYSDIEE